MFAQIFQSICKRMNAPTYKTGRLATVFAFVALMLGFCGKAVGQIDISSSLAGSVVDQTGALVPNAQVSVHNVQTGVDAHVASGSLGEYRFVSLQAGTYTVTCTAEGFSNYRATSVVLHAGGVTTLPIKLEVGGATQTVTVSGSSAMVDTETANNLTTIDPDLMQGIPVQGRDPRESMETLMPGATAAGTGASFFVPVTSFNGVSQLTNNYEIDGAAMNDYMHGSAATSFPQSENISEFSVASALPDASVARGAGGQVEATLKSGTNQFHGQFWTYMQNAGWNANSWSNKFKGIRRQPFKQRWYGGNVGGPVEIPKLYNGKGKTFFFASYERTSTSKNSTTTGQTITDAERAGDFTNSPDGIPVVNGTPMPIIPVSDFGPLGLTLNGPNGTSIMPAPTSGIDTFTWNPSFSAVVQTWVARIDTNLGSKNRIFGSLWSYNNTSTFQDMYDEFSEASWATQYPNGDLSWGEPVKTNVWAVNDTYTITPSMLNNLVLGLTQSEISITNTCSPCKGLINPANTGIGSVGDSLAPDVQQISTPRSMGMGLYNGYVNPMTQHTWDVTDNFTWSLGRHTLKAGIELRNYHEVFNQTWGAGANVSFKDSNKSYGGTGNGIADMLLNGGPLGQFGARFSQNSTQNLIVDYPAREAYLQDTMKVTPRLTVMAGVRMQPYFGVREQKNRFTTFRPGQQSSVFPTAPAGLVTVGDSGIPRNLSGDVFNFGPRFSFAWDIFGSHKAALKGGYGLYTDYEYLLNFNGYTTSPPYGVSYYPTQGPGFDLSHPYAQYGSNPFPYTAPTAGSPAAQTLVFPKVVSTQAVAANFNNGLYHKFNVEFQFEPINTYVVSASWVATRGTHLFEQHNANWPQFVPGGSTNASANVLSREPYYPAGFNQINTFYSDYNSWYNSMQLEVNKRMSHGLTLMATYTLSESTGQQGCRYRGNCALDYYSPGATNQVTFAFRYMLPSFLHPHSFADKILGGWAVGGTGTASTGGYGSVGDYNCNEFNFSSAGCYANYTGGGALLANRKQVVMRGGSEIGVSWLDPSKFIRADQQMANGTPTTMAGVGQQLFLGNARLGVYKGPASGIQYFNASLDKDFGIWEAVKLNFHAEAFNVLNHTVLNMPDYNNTVGPNTTGFGIISSARAPRSIQLSFHAIF